MVEEEPVKLYLVQHGEAVAKDVHPERPLSDIGRDDIRILAAFLAGAGVHVAQVINSGKIRARQTAEILAAAIAPGVTIADIASGLAPNDSTDWLLERAGQWDQDTVVVGHMPFMGRAVSRLVVGSEDANLLSFVPGSVVCLGQNRDAASWAMEWMIRPDLFRHQL
jgi:phosphohistidine phosphatase